MEHESSKYLWGSYRGPGAGLRIGMYREESGGRVPWSALEGGE